FILQKGAVEIIVDRSELRQTIYNSLSMMKKMPFETVKLN
ncbi:MAG: hypothetical protein RLY82_816, partial [Pseudomonadota bacterium]